MFNSKAAQTMLRCSLLALVTMVPPVIPSTPPPPPPPPHDIPSPRHPCAKSHESYAQLFVVDIVPPVTSPLLNLISIMHTLVCSMQDLFVPFLSFFGKISTAYPEQSTAGEIVISLLTSRYNMSMPKCQLSKEYADNGEKKTDFKARVYDGFFFYLEQSMTKQIFTSLGTQLSKALQALSSSGQNGLCGWIWYRTLRVNGDSHDGQVVKCPPPAGDWGLFPAIPSLVISLTC